MSKGKEMKMKPEGLFFFSGTPGFSNEAIDIRPELSQSMIHTKKRIKSHFF